MNTTTQSHFPLSAADPRARWQLRANRRIEYRPGAANDRATIIKRNEFVTAAYAELYLRNPAVYKWAGMAALTSAAVGRGMYMMRGLRLSHAWSMMGLFGREVAETAIALGVGNIAVFNDIYWQHLAYEHAGLAELERIYAAGKLGTFCYDGWRKIDAGHRANDPELIWEGNRDLLYYEQKETLQPAVYDGRETTWKMLSGWIASPIPGHNETIEAFSPRANIGVFADRWRWIERRMLPAWRRLAEQRPEYVASRLEVRLIGGPPFLLPQMFAGRLGQPVRQVIGLGGLPKV